MANRDKFIPIQRFNHAKILGIEKHLLKTHYSFLNINITNGVLKCIGKCTPSEFSKTYAYALIFTPGKHPKVYTVEPKIEYHKDIHMYPDDNRLCLYYPRDFSWTSKSHLYNTIIPWTHEWFTFYELFQIYGTWLHPSVPHGEIK